MTDEQVDALPTLPLVIAHCAPHTKTRMIATLHRPLLSLDTSNSTLDT